MAAASMAPASLLLIGEAKKNTEADSAVGKLKRNDQGGAEAVGPARPDPFGELGITAS